jgi:hypothetical protein
MSATVIPFPGRRPRGNCARCGSILDDDPHDCDAALDTTRRLLWANGWRADDEELPEDVREMLRGWSPDDPPPEAA